MNLKEIEKLIQLVLGTDIEEIELTRGEDSLRVRRRQSGDHAPGGAAIPPAYHAPGQEPAVESDTAGAAQRANLLVVRSPLVGTFYRSSTPDAKPFVEVEETVSRGQVICIVEAMKLMNEIEAETDGRIVSILVDNGRPVEYGEPLFEIEPLE